LAGTFLLLFYPPRAVIVMNRTGEHGPEYADRDYEGSNDDPLPGLHFYSSS
jgi:hypothetical protein